MRKRTHMPMNAPIARILLSNRMWHSSRSTENIGSGPCGLSFFSVAIFMVGKHDVPPTYFPKVIYTLSLSTNCGLPNDEMSSSTHSLDKNVTLLIEK